MCGIAGLFFPGGANPDRLRTVAAAACRAHAYRGPDGDGTYADDRVALGHVRLAIVGAADQGAQPLHDRWGGTLIFNGEVYDHRAVLKDLGEPFDPRDSDGIALAAVLARRGPAGLANVRGMFAAARYDPTAGTLLLVRDAHGQKPLYVRQLADGWAFASTVAALVAASGPVEIRPDAIPEYLIFRSVGGCHSAYRGVEQLPPGSWMELSADGSVRRGRWHDFPPALDRADGPEVVRQTLDAAIAARCQSDTEIGVFLSGGLDSSIVAASLRRQRPDQRVRFISVGYDVAGWEDEHGKARDLAEALGRPHETVKLTAADIPAYMADVARLTEDPIQDPVTLPTLLLARAAARFTKVVLTGDASDEFWGGYARFDDAPATLDEYLTRAMTFTPADLGLARFPASYLDDIPVPAADLPPLDRIFRLEVANRMRNYHLARVDKVSMGAGLEARSPFLDVRVADLALSLPATHKRPGGKAKGLLAAAFADDLPDWLLKRAKQPFSVPIGTWLAGPLRGFAADTLGDPGAFVRAWVDPRPYLARLDAGPAEAAAVAPRVWSLLQLEVWHRATAPLRTGEPA